MKFDITDLLKLDVENPDLRAFLKALVSKMGTLHTQHPNMSVEAMVARFTKMAGNVSFTHRWNYECFGPDGVLKWDHESFNLFVNTGLDEALEQLWKGSGYTASHFVGLKDTGSPVAGDTMASHASWATISPYSNATDPALVLGTVTSQSVDNVASKAVFNCDATDEIFGAFIKDNNTVDGATGLLMAVDDFSSSKNVDNLDTLNVTVTLTAASA